MSVAPHVGMGLHATVSLHAGIMSGLAFTGLMHAVTHVFIVSPVFCLNYDNNNSYDPIGKISIFDILLLYSVNLYHGLYIFNVVCPPCLSLSTVNTERVEAAAQELSMISCMQYVLSMYLKD